MILLRSQTHEALKQALKNAEVDLHPRKWADSVRGQEKCGLDPFLAIQDYGFGTGGCGCSACG
ncbi:MAG: hypothetical protein C0504_12475 [Candidatus Solibacter sp.]|nr:hypothetical protein [Candidatus Solibacter sp.]